jgi:uncharacterized phage-associated protein
MFYICSWVSKRMSSEPNIRFDYDKFVDAVHFVCGLFKERPESLGQVKLHKVLYFSDMISYFDRGEPLTGCEYQKQPHGPTAQYLAKALKQLEAEKRVKVSWRKVYGYKKAEFEVLEQLKTNRLSDYDRQLISDVADWASGKTAVEISELSHKKPWQSVDQGERIDYATAAWLFPSKGPSQRDVQWAEEAAALIVAGKVPNSFEP